MTETKWAQYWVLRDAVSGYYFREWSDIPRCTKTRGKAERFPSKRKALQSPAYSFALSSFEPEAVAMDQIMEIRVEREEMKHLMQPIVIDDADVPRFKENALIRYLVDVGDIDLNRLAALPDIPDEDRMQLAQLIGYSVSGFGNLSYADPSVVAAADAIAESLPRPASGQTKGTVLTVDEVERMIRRGDTEEAALQVVPKQPCPECARLRGALRELDVAAGVVGVPRPQAVPERANGCGSMALRKEERGEE